MPTVFRLALLSLVFGLYGCSRYDLLLNDNLVWQAQPLFDHYEVEDPALQNCLAATIEAKQIRQATGLTELNCRQAGIKSLAGLEQFSRLEQLYLAGNPLQQIEAIYQLVNLEVLELEQTSSLVCSQRQRLEALSISRLQIGAACN